MDKECEWCYPGCKFFVVFAKKIMVTEKIETPSITIEAEKVVLNESSPAETIAGKKEDSKNSDSWKNWKTGLLAAGVLVLGGAVAHKLLKEDN